MGDDPAESPTPSPSPSAKLSAKLGVDLVDDGRLPPVTWGHPASIPNLPACNTGAGVTAVIWTVAGAEVRPLASVAVAETMGDRPTTGLGRQGIDNGLGIDNSEQGEAVSVCTGLRASCRPCGQRSGRSADPVSPDNVAATARAVHTRVIPPPSTLAIRLLCRLSWQGLKRNRDRLFSPATGPVLRARTRRRAPPPGRGSANAAWRTAG